MTAAARHTGRFIVRGIVTSVLAVLAVAAAIFVWNFFSQKFYRTTGRAAWIWAQQKVSSGDPLVFFAAKSFDLPPERPYARISIAADPEYTLFLNGSEIGGGRAHDRVALDVYDVTAKARDRGNRIVVAVRSPRGVGGLIAAVDAGPMLENIVVSDASWRIFRRWDERLLGADVEGGAAAHEIGRPPMGKWDYPPERRRPVTAAQPSILSARAVRQYATRLPVIKVVGGVAIGTSEPSQAAAFDFGAVEGRARIELQPGVLRTVRVRLANHDYELEEPGEVFPLVVAEGERVVVDPEVRRFRIIVLHDAEGVATVLQSK